MGFQKQINDGLGAALPGDIVQAHSTHLLIHEMVTEDDKCVIGTFVRVGSDERKCINTANASKVVGIIVNDRLYGEIGEGTTLQLGASVSVCMYGVVAIKNTTKTNASFGQKVYVSDTDGSLSFADADVSGSSDTLWTVKEGGKEGDIIFITK